MPLEYTQVESRMMKSLIPIVNWSFDNKTDSVEAFLSRPAFSPVAEAAAAKALADIQARGNAAVLDAAKAFDQAEMTADQMLITAAELDAAEAAVSQDIKDAVLLAYDRVKRFSEAGLRDDWEIKSPYGGRLGEKFKPMQRVGVYIPGGTAPLASTAIMTVVLARVAGVKEIVACTPSRGGLAVNPALLYALKVAGATEIYRIGGIQSIGMMAFGTETVRPVNLIAGPGNAFVTAAKRQVYGYVGIDQVAGPSEIAVLADEDANPDWVAADLISQAEHGSGLEKSFLVTNSQAVAERVRDAVVAQVMTRNRRDIIERMLTNKGMLMVVVPDLDQGVELCNRFAAEHLELQVKEANAYLDKVTCAGAVFVGYWTPESAGDFIAGPSHVLPTGGAARMFSGLTSDTFRTRMSFAALSQEELAHTRKAIETFGALEGLDGHGFAATVRFN